MTLKFQTFWSDQSGATSIEYALIAGLISLVIIGGAKVVGVSLIAKFSQVAGNLS